VGLFNARLFARMKRGAYFINIARGRCVLTQDLIAALQSGQLAGAGSTSPTRAAAGRQPALGHAQCTHHAPRRNLGTPYRRKWEEILLENCRRFAAGQPLRNIVDKQNTLGGGRNFHVRQHVRALDWHRSSTS
jgi:phosphoglycerate dehydrogenase-like enzyme